MILYLEEKTPNKKIYLTESQVMLLSEASMSLDDVYKKHYEGKVDADTFKKIVSSDPTFNQEKGNKMGKFGKWLLSLYINKNLKLEDLYKATQYLSVFIKYSQKIEDKDINHYKSLPQLYNVVEPFMDGDIASSKSEEIRKIKEGAEKVYEDDSWLVIIPHTQEAAIYYGKGTQWCTAAETSDNYFDYYNQDGYLYININKRNNRKYQFHFESGQFMDETDAEIIGSIFETIGASNGLRQFYLGDRTLSDYLHLTFGEDTSELYDQNGKTVRKDILSVTMPHSDGTTDSFLCKLLNNGGYEILAQGTFDPQVISKRYVRKLEVFSDGWVKNVPNIFDLKTNKMMFDSDQKIEFIAQTHLFTVKEKNSVSIFDYTNDIVVTNRLDNVSKIKCVNPIYKTFVCYNFQDRVALYSTESKKYLTDFIFKGYKSTYNNEVMVLPLVSDNGASVMLYCPYHNIISQKSYPISEYEEKSFELNMAWLAVGKLKHYNLNQEPMPNIVSESLEIILESRIPEMNEIGMIEYSCDFDEEYYQEWLQDNGYENSEESLLKYYQTEIEYEIELFDSEYYHHMDWVNMFYEDICDEFNEEMANVVVKDCMEDGHGQLETLDFICNDIDINNPEELNAEAMKILRNGRYFKDCRGYILSNGVVVYTEQEHNMASRINGIKGTYNMKFS